MLEKQVHIRSNKTIAKDLYKSITIKTKLLEMVNDVLEIKKILKEKVGN